MKDSVKETANDTVNERERLLEEGEVQETSPSPEAAISETMDEAVNEREDAQDEAEILRSELANVQAQLADAKKESADFKDKFLRARADMENYRRRTAQDLERARESGVDSAIHAVLPAYDDLGRALQAAKGDPSKIIPGVEAVREGLKRNLEALGIEEVGRQGERFNPDFHEALAAVDAEDKEFSGTISEVFQVGFLKGERLIRPARVVVYQ